MKLLYFSPSSYGGLADYAHAQAQALAEEGVEVTLLCGPDFPEYPISKYDRLPNLLTHRSNPSPLRLMRAWRMGRMTVENHLRLAREVRSGDYAFVLFGSYSEYFAPLWAARLKRLRDVRWGAVIHDPVRDTIMGPGWWHRRSVAAAYSLLQLAFVHEETPLKTEGSGSVPKTTVIPHGPYSFPSTNLSKSDARRRLELPEKATILLLFGHIRDSKNLDLVLDILPDFPKVHLLVAGKEQSGGQLPASYYQDRARRNNVAERCHWVIDHIPEEEVELYFTAANYLLLPYRNHFRSASRVLNASIQFRLPCLATSGAGPLRSAVTQYALGVWRPADDPAALKDGLKTLLLNPPAAQWERYLEDNDWRRNARAVIDAFNHPAMAPACEEARELSREGTPPDSLNQKTVRIRAECKP